MLRLFVILIPLFLNASICWCNMWWRSVSVGGGTWCTCPEEGSWDSGHSCTWHCSRGNCNCDKNDKSGFEKWCSDKCKGHVALADGTEGICKCQSCSDIVRDYYNKCQGRLKPSLSCIQMGDSINLNYTSWKDACLPVDNNSTSNNSSTSPNGTQSSYTKSQCISAGGAWLCYNGSCSCIIYNKTSDSNNSNSGSNSNSNNNSNYTSLFQQLNNSINSKGDLLSQLLYNANSRLSSGFSSINSNLNYLNSNIMLSNGYLSDIDTQVKTINQKMGNVSKSLSSLGGVFDKFTSFLNNPSKVQATVSKSLSSGVSKYSNKQFVSSDTSSCSSLTYSFTLAGKTITFNLNDFVNAMPISLIKSVLYFVALFGLYVICLKTD